MGLNDAAIERFPPIYGVFSAFMAGNLFLGFEDFWSVLVYAWGISMQFNLVIVRKLFMRFEDVRLFFFI